MKMQPCARRKQHAQDGEKIEPAMSCRKCPHGKCSDMNFVARRNGMHAGIGKPVFLCKCNPRLRDVNGAHALGKDVDVTEMVEVRVRDKNGVRRTCFFERHGSGFCIFFAVRVKEQPR